MAAGKLSAGDIDDETLRGYLYDSETPDPDHEVRTAGEMRLSNFLLWQASYADPPYVTQRSAESEFSRRPTNVSGRSTFAGRNLHGVHPGLLPVSRANGSHRSSLAPGARRSHRSPCRGKNRASKILRQ